MAVSLVTGYAGTDEDGKPIRSVSSSEDGARQAGTVGKGMYAFDTGDQLAATLENANTVSVASGDVIVNGRHIQFTGSTAFAIPVGTQGMKTSSILAVRYAVAEDGTENAEAVTITGEPSDSDPEDPQLATGSVLDGDSPVEMPLYRVVTTGIETTEPERLFETIPSIEGMVSMLAGKADKAHKHSAADVASGTLPVARGGTGVTSDAAIALKSYPVGSVYLSFDPTSPASLFGGTWAQISGRFLRAANDTAAGGSDSHTLTAAQMPSHAHVWKMGGKERVGYGISGSAGSFVDGLALASSGSAISIDPSGGGQTHNNMPAYQDVYAWRRTA